MYNLKNYSTIMIFTRNTVIIYVKFILFGLTRIIQKSCNFVVSWNPVILYEQMIIIMLMIFNGDTILPCQPQDTSSNKGFV